MASSVLELGVLAWESWTTSADTVCVVRGLTELEYTGCLGVRVATTVVPQLQLLDPLTAARNIPSYPWGFFKKISRISRVSVWKGHPSIPLPRSQAAILFLSLPFAAYLCSFPHPPPFSSHLSICPLTIPG